MGKELEAFDYASLTANEAQAVRSEAEWVRSTYRTLQATTLETSIAIGQRLLRVRETIGHGKFLPWVASEFEFSARTGQRMMQAAEHFAGEQMRHVSHLPHKVVYALSSPSPEVEPVRVYVKERAAAGEAPEAGEIERRISEAKNAARAASKPERKARDELRRRRETKAEEKRAAEQAAQFEREKKEAEEAFLMIANLLGSDLRRFSALIAGGNLYRFGQMIQQAARESAA